MAKEQEACYKNQEVGARSGGFVKPGRAQKRYTMTGGRGLVCEGEWNSELKLSGSWPPWQEAPAASLL